MTMSKVEQRLFDLEEYLMRNDDRADSSAYLTIVGIANDVSELEAKNAKLRELVRDMMRFFEDGDWCTTCEQACKCESQEQYEEDCLMRDVFHHRMRELEIEVDG